MGGVFNLGQTNTVDATSTLAGNPAGNPLLRLTGSGTAATIRADAGNGTAVNGTSTSGTGQLGESTSGVGLYGLHRGGAGSASAVYGQTNSTDPASSGVTGSNMGGGPGLRSIVTGNTVPPLKVNSSAKVQGLNADLLDGLDSSGFWKDEGGILGTTGPLQFWVNGRPAMEFVPNNGSTNIVAGWAGNTLTGSDQQGAIVAGGGGQFDGANYADGNFDTVSGGAHNNAAGDYSTVSGGFENGALALLASVLGGENNTASGSGSVVAGGVGNSASGNESFAAGTMAHATQTGAFVWGDNSGNPLASNGVNTVSFGATGGARFVTAFSGGNPSAGVSVAAGGGSWSSLSDRDSKRDLAQIDRARLLAKLDRIPITRWSYRSQRPSIRHLGPMAQDFRAAFGLGEDSRHIDTIDSEGVALAAIQGLYRQNQALERQNQALHAELDAQDARLTRLEQAFSKLSR